MYAQSWKLLSSFDTYFQWKNARLLRLSGSKWLFHRKDLTNSSTGTSSICMSDRSRVLSSSLSFKLLFPTDTGILSINRWWQSISQTRMLNYNSKVNLGCSKRSEQAPQNQKRKRPQLSLEGSSFKGRPLKKNWWQGSWRYQVSRI